MSEPSIIGEQNQKDFISLFGAILRMKNLLSSFDEFAGNEIVVDRDFQDYCGRYLDIKDDFNYIGKTNSKDIDENKLKIDELKYMLKNMKITKFN